MLASKFEDLRMLEDETISDFNSKLCNIANEAFTLSEKYSETKLVRETLRSLPERFAYKVAAIEEAKDVSTMKLDELMGSLQTFELNLSQNKKEKSVDVRTKEKGSTNEGNSIDDESLVLLMKNLNIFLNKMNRKNNSQKSKKHVSSIESKNQHIKDSDGSQGDDDHVSNTVTFQVTSKKDVTESVTTNVTTPKTRN